MKGHVGKKVQEYFACILGRIAKLPVVVVPCEIAPILEVL